MQNEPKRYDDQVVIIEALPGMRTVFTSNEYVEQLESRIALVEETERHYIRAIALASTYFQRAKYMRERRITAIKRLYLIEIKMFIEAAMAQRNEDLHNNINRYCTIPGDRKPRQWRVVFAMQRDEKGWPTYLVRKVNDPDVFKVVSMIQMTNLY